MGQERLGPSYFLISLVLGPLNKPLMVRTFLKTKNHHCTTRVMVAASSHVPLYSLVHGEYPKGIWRKAIFFLYPNEGVYPNESTQRSHGVRLSVALSLFLQEQIKDIIIIRSLMPL